MRPMGKKEAQGYLNTEKKRSSLVCVGTGRSRPMVLVGAGRGEHRGDPQEAILSAVEGKTWVHSSTTIDQRGGILTPGT